MVRHKFFKGLAEGNTKNFYEAAIFSKTYKIIPNVLFITVLVITVRNQYYCIYKNYNTNFSI